MAAYDLPLPVDFFSAAGEIAIVPVAPQREAARGIAGPGEGHHEGRAGEKPPQVHPAVTHGLGACCQRPGHVRSPAEVQTRRGRFGLREPRADAVAYGTRHARQDRARDRRQQDGVDPSDALTHRRIHAGVVAREQRHTDGVDVLSFHVAECGRLPGTGIVGAVGAGRIVGVAVAGSDALAAAVEGFPPSADAVELARAAGFHGSVVDGPLGLRVQIPVHTLGGGPLPGFECCGVAVQGGDPLIRAEGIPPLHDRGNVRGIHARIHAPEHGLPDRVHVGLFVGNEQRRYTGARIVGAVGAVRVVGVAVARGDALLAAVEGLPPSADAAQGGGGGDSRGGSMNQPLGFRIQIPVHTLGGGPLPGFECCGVAVQGGDPLRRFEGVPPAHGQGTVRGIHACVHAPEQGLTDRVHMGLFVGAEQRRPAGARIVGAVGALRVLGVAVARGDASAAAVEGLPPAADAAELYVPVDRIRGGVDKALGCHVQVGVGVLGNGHLVGGRIIAVQGGRPLLSVEDIPPAHGRVVVGDRFGRRIVSLCVSLTLEAERKKDKQRENHKGTQRAEPLSVAVSRS